MQLRQVLAQNLKKAMDEQPGLDTHMAISKRAGIAQSHFSKVMRGEASATTDLIAALAKAVNREPWELLADSEATRKSALERMILGPRVPDEKVEKHLPVPPKEVAAKHRKKDRGGENRP